MKIVTETYWTNPQYRISIVDPDDEDDENAGTLIVAVLQRRKPKASDMLKLGYSIYKVNCLGVHELGS
jgi:calpain